ncbi:MAG: IS66 family transposase [Gammaproteobacteria bacterium]|nr:IS66 family transposase [Gammaproteobacteria bacterium]
MNSMTSIATDELEKLQQQLAIFQKNNAELEQTNSKLQAKVNWFEEQYRLAQLKRFGRSSEKHDGQIELFNEAEVIADEDNAQADDLSERQTITYTWKKPGRKPLPKDLPREVIRHELPESEQVCSCGCQLHVIGEDKTEQLDFIPAKIKVIEHVQVKYGCRACEQGVTVAPKPPQPIPRSIATPGLLSYVIVSKFLDSLPLYRQEGIFKRLAIDIPRATLSNWVLKSAELLKPYYDRLLYYLILEKIIQADETTLRVVQDGRDSNTKSYMWLYQSGSLEPGHSIILYDYQPTRAGEHAKTFLSGFKGTVQCDGFSGYNALTKNNNPVTLIGCMAHARRKFDEAYKALPAKSKQKPGMAQMALAKIRKLYAIEKQIKNLSSEQRYLLRQAKSKPVLEDLKAYAEKSVLRTPKDSLIGQAFRYLLNQWESLIGYINDGNLQIDNNAAERSIKPFVIGRKNWLMNQTARGANASALLYSLMQTAKANNLEPYAFLRYILTEIPLLGRHHLTEELDQFMPWNMNETIPLLNKVG